MATKQPKAPKSVKKVSPKKSAKRPNVKAEYDFTKPISPAGGRKMRLPVVEKKPEEDVLGRRHRLEGINLARDMVRNHPQTHGLAKTLRANIVGAEGKLRFNSQDEWYIGAQRWFNDVWSRHANFRDHTTFRECLQLAVYALSFEGDFVAVFDDGILTGGTGSGRLCFFEADQIVDLDKDSFAPLASHGLTQRSGVLFDRFGRKCGVVVSHLRGVTETPASEAIVLRCDPANPDAAPWRHVFRKWRFEQARGIPDSFSALQTGLDSLGILGYTLTTAKVAASSYAHVIESPNEDGGMPTGFDDGTSATPTEAEELALIENEEQYSRAEALERYTGGNVDYLPSGSSIQFDPGDRPGPNVRDFLDYTTDLVGQSFGLGHAFARSKADTSYTSFRGDLCMTAQTFADFCQFLEDSFSDWVAVSAINWGIARGEVPTAPQDWQELVAWSYPRLPEVDEQKAQSAIAQKFKNGLTTFRDELGPAWREKLQQLADEAAFAKSIGLPLSIFETASGGIASTTPEEQ